MGNKKKSENYKEEKNLLEYIVFYGSLAMVVGLLGYLIHATVTYESSEPNLNIVFKAKPQAKSPHLFQVSVQNTGNSTAEDVVIEMIQQKDGKEIERSQLQMMFVSGNTNIDGWINFSKDPAKADTIYARVVSYKSS